MLRLPRHPEAPEQDEGGRHNAEAEGEAPNRLEVLVAKDENEDERNEGAEDKADVERAVGGEGEPHVRPPRVHAGRLARFRAGNRAGGVCRRLPLARYIFEARRERQQIVHSAPTGGRGKHRGQRPASPYRAQDGRRLTANACQEAVYDEGSEHAVDRALVPVGAGAKGRSENHDAGGREHGHPAAMAVDDPAESELADDDTEIRNTRKDLAICGHRKFSWCRRNALLAIYDGYCHIAWDTSCSGEG